MLMNFVKPSFQMDKIVDDIISDRWNHAMSERHKEVFAPTDIIESEGKININIELPGLSKEDVNVEIKEKMLKITGTKKEYEKKEDTTFYRTERTFGEFSKSFELSRDLDHENITAEFQNGVLTLVIPKITPKESEVKAIEIK